MRNILIIVGICIVAVAAGAWLYFKPPVNAPPAGPHTNSATSSSSEKEVKFKVLDQGANAQGMPTRKNYAIYDAGELADFWKKAHGQDGTPMPSVDFSKSYVIAVFAGTEPTGGYSISVDKITDADGVRSVSVIIDEPGAECTVVEEITSPYQFVVVPFSDNQALSHTDVRVKKDCTS